MKRILQPFETQIERDKMKIHREKCLLSCLLICCLLVFTACKSINPTTGVREYDPVKTESVKAALEVPVKGGIRRSILNSPQHSDEIANYFRSVGSVFCKMQTTAQFEPSTLIDELNKFKIPQLENQIVADVKDAMVAIYRILYAQRFTAELSPEKWPYHVADFFCKAINTALIDAGKPGVSAQLINQALAAYTKAMQPITIGSK